MILQACATHGTGVHLTKEYSESRNTPWFILMEKKQMQDETKRRNEKAQDKALESLDYILEVIPAPDFVEVVGRVGGDTVTYRVYDDGSMYER